MRRPRRLRGIDVEPSGIAEVPAVCIPGDARHARTRVGADQHEPERRRDLLRMGFERKVLVGAGQPSEKIKRRDFALARLRRKINGELHRPCRLTGVVLVEALHTAVAAVLGNDFRCAHQYTTTLRIDSPLCMRSNARLMSFSGIWCVIRSSMLILPSMYQSTILGTSVRPRAPPKAVPFQMRPVTSWNGRVLISLPAPATPMITDPPQPRWVHSSAWRISSVLPTHSKL